MKKNFHIAKSGTLDLNVMAVVLFVRSEKIVISCFRERTEPAATRRRRNNLMEDIFKK